MQLRDVLEIVGLLLVFGGLIWAALRFILTRIETVQTHTTTSDEKSRERDNAIREDLTLVKQEYVRKDELMDHIHRIERGQESLAMAMSRNQEVLQAGIDRVHARLDGFTMTRTPGHNANRGHDQ